MTMPAFIHSPRGSTSVSNFPDNSQKRFTYLQSQNLFQLSKDIDITCRVKNRGHNHTLFSEIAESQSLRGRQVVQFTKKNGVKALVNEH